MACKNIHCPTADNIAKLKRLSSPNRLSRVCRFRRQAERGLPRPRTLPVGIPFESRVLPTRLYFFPCAPARNRFALRRRSLLPKAFAPAATWTRLCSRSSRTGGWLHSRHRETSTYPYLFSEETGSALSRGGIWARLLRPLATMGSHLTAGSGWNRASRFAFRMPCRRAASRT